MFSATRSVKSLCRLKLIYLNVCSVVGRCNGTWLIRDRHGCNAVKPLKVTKFYSVDCIGTYSSGIERANCGKRGRKLSVSDVQEVFNCRPQKADTIIRQFPRLKNFSVDYLSNSFRYVTQQGLSLYAVQENPWILTISQDDLENRLSLIRTLGFDSIDDGVPLAQIPLPQLMKLCTFWKMEKKLFPAGCRIRHLSEKLQCPVSVACDLLVKYSFLRTMLAIRLKENLDLLLNAGVSSSNLVKDVWSLRIRTEIVKERLQRGMEAGLPVIKPWLIRCKPEVIERTLERHLQNRALLGNKSLLEFLAHRLKCDMETAVIMTQKYPNVLHVNITKINEILDLLEEEGFIKEQVVQVPRILCHGLETTRARLEELRSLGYNPVSLMVLCLSQHEYNKVVHKLERRNSRAVL